MIKKYFKKFFSIALVFASFSIQAQTVPDPKSHFGFNIGDDYQLANYTQTEGYFKKIAASSDRTKLVDIGKTEEGRSQYMMIVSSPENIKNLEKYKSISQKLGRAEVSVDEARKLAQEGKSIVWIDGGLHANETVGIHQLIQTMYNFTSRTDAETMRILNDVIILFTHANPDGQELISDWYMRHKDQKNRTISGVPRMYQKWGGHDNNRDFFILNMKESQNMARQMYIEWLPQIMYNHHQAGPAGTVVAGPPFRDPHNYNFDPLVLTGIDAVGAAMQNRLSSEDKPGYAQRNGSSFSNWYNGGLRTTTYFHNIIGLLTEIVGGPTPTEIPLVPNRLLSSGDGSNPVTPRKWHFQNAIDYSVTMNYAVLSYAQRYRDDLLFNIYKMGTNSIERGKTDTRAIFPKTVEELNQAVKAAKDKDGNKTKTDIEVFNSIMKASEKLDPRGYIIPSDQADFNTAVKFLNALIKTGIVVQKASTDFTVEGKKYPAGSYVVKMDQPFRAHVMDMFEPQDHPNDFKFEGGAPTPPYDAAGWTLAYLMNVKFDRILKDFDGPFQKNAHGEVIKVEHKLPSGSSYVLSANQNDSYAVVNTLLKQNIEVNRSNDSGDFYVTANANTKSILEKANIKVQVGNAPANKKKISNSRIAIWDVYGGSMPSGWMRFIMDQFNYNANVIYAQDVDAGNLKSKYDVIIFVGGAIAGPDDNSNARVLSQQKIVDLPAEYNNRLGVITADKSIPKIKQFMEEGGRVIAIGSSTSLAGYLNLPVRNALVEIKSGTEVKLPREKYFIPGSVLNVQVDNKNSSTWGLESSADVYFNNSPVFKSSTDAITSGKIKPLMWFSKSNPLRSGWVWGPAYLQDGIAAFEAPIGKGKLLAFGPEISFRAQTHGTFKLLFNQLYN